MQALGAPLMLVCSNTSPHVARRARRAPRRSCTSWPSAPRKRNLRIGYEALAWGRHVNLYGQAWEHRRSAPTIRTSA